MNISRKFARRLTRDRPVFMRGADDILVSGIGMGAMGAAICLLSGVVKITVARLLVSSRSSAS